MSENKIKINEGLFQAFKEQKLYISSSKYQHMHWYLYSFYCH